MTFTEIVHIHAGKWLKYKENRDLELENSFRNRSSSRLKKILTVDQQGKIKKTAVFLSGGQRCLHQRGT